jgi:hypothetical protein
MIKPGKVNRNKIKALQKLTLMHSFIEELHIQKLYLLSIKWRENVD